MAIPSVWLNIVSRAGTPSTAKSLPATVWTTYELAGGVAAAENCSRPNKQDMTRPVRMCTDIPRGVVRWRKGIFSKFLALIRCEVYEEINLHLRGVVDVGGVSRCAADTACERSESGICQATGDAR